MSLSFSVGVVAARRRHIHLEEELAMPTTKEATRVLAVSAHPDDLEFGAAGTLARWVREGAEVTYCIVSDGSTGTQERELVGPALARIRRTESERAAEVVGAREIAWLGYRDGYIEHTLGLRRDIARAFRRHRPHRFVVLDPTPVIGGFFINHPDHRAVGQASLDVTLTAGTTPGHFPELLDEGLEPWRGLREVWISSPGEKATPWDISATIDVKIEALLCHRSQVGEDAETVASWVRSWTADRGRPRGFAHAEPFEVIEQGPGFHAAEQSEEVDPSLARADEDPRSATLRGGDQAP